MLSVNQDSELESIIPSVHVRKITLISGGSSPFESNPHIDHEREPRSVRDATTGKIKRLPPDKAEFEFKKEGNGSPMTIEIDLVMKERLNNGVLGSWFANQDFMKYMRLKIIQSTNQGFTTKFATKELDTTSLEFENYWRLYKGSGMGGFSVKTISADATQTASSLNQHITETDDDGNVIHNIVFHVTFDIPNSEPKYLAYFAMSYLDVEMLARDFSLDLPPGMEKELEKSL